ncbi:MAG: CHAT domain-containing protein, partial [Myxococcales bacterium]|nr:CHAT domain-containing protein [Myxococcales bacterium]
MTISMRQGVGGYEIELLHDDGHAQYGPCKGPAAFDLEMLSSLQPRPVEYGRALAEQLFSDSRVAEGFVVAEAVAQRSGGFLRVLVRVDESAPELQTLRWEMLQHPRSGVALSTSERVVLCRFMASGDHSPVKPLARTGLTALVAVSAPTPESLERWRIDEVDYEGEVHRVREALDGIEVHTLGGPASPLTLERLGDALRHEVDIVYLVCHGMIGRRGTPALVLQDEAGAGKLVESQALAARIRELRVRPRLVVLASCQSAGDGEQGSAGPHPVALTTTASLLAEAGVPAVIAMQGFVSMKTVELMMPKLFSELLHHGEIDRALAVARGRVRDRDDWWMPVLFTRLKGGALWSTPGSVGSASVSPRMEAEKPSRPSTMDNQGASIGQQINVYGGGTVTLGATTIVQPAPSGVAPPSATTPTPPGPPIEPSPSSTVSAAEWADYCEAVRQRYGVNRFIGFTSAFECQLAWEELYVDLVMDKAHGHSKDLRATEPVPEPRDLREQEGTKVSLDEAFAHAHENDRRALVMLGDPGSGKTTQLQQVLLWMLDRERGPTSLRLPEGTVPVFVALQEFPGAIKALGAHAGFEALVAWAAAQHLGELSAQLIGRLLASPRVLYLLDGLDEIPDPEQRVQVSTTIAKAHVNGPSEHHMLVSSRYAGYSDVKQVHRALDNAFLELKLRPLDDEQVEHLVRNWNRAVESREARKQGRPASEQEAQRRAEALLRRIRAPGFTGEDQLAQMARTPLLLTALCLIDRERRRKRQGGLPKDREAIYAECEEILLEQWQLEARRGKPSLGAEEAGRILQPVAYWLHGEEKRRHARVAELRGPVEEGLRAAKKAGEDAGEFVRSFTSESGLLTPWGPQEYGFVHLGFQEHLAALHVRERWARGEVELVQVLAGRFDEGWWREVIRLMLAGAEAGLVEGFMGAVARRPEFAEWSRMRLMSLCLRGEAGPAGARALVELLRATVGVVTAEQQGAALRLLVQQVPGVLEGHDEWLRAHPVEEVRRRWLGRTRRDEVGRTKVDPKSGVELVWIPGGWFTMGSAV